MSMEATAQQQEPMRESAARFIEQHARPLELAQYRVYVAEDDPNEAVEALVRPGARYFRALQWHPEVLYTVDEPSRRLFRSFVTACAR